MKLLLMLIISFNVLSETKLAQSEFFNYEVKFTNPICEDYAYDPNEAVVDNESILFEQNLKMFIAKTLILKKMN